MPRIAETTPLKGAAPVAHGVVRLEQAITLHDLQRQHVQKRSGGRTRRVGQSLLVAQLSTITATNCGAAPASEAGADLGQPVLPPQLR